MSVGESTSKHDFSGGFDLPAVVTLLERIAGETNCVEGEVAAHDVAFHMTDWANDLRDLFELYSNPDAYSMDQAKRIVSGFLVHVPAHVAAAAKLYLDDPVTDVFGVGAVKEQGD